MPGMRDPRVRLADDPTKAVANRAANRIVKVAGWERHVSSNALYSLRDTPDETTEDRMIRSFADRRTVNVFDGVRERTVPASILGRARRKLDRINAAAHIGDLRIPPGNRLERLSGDRDGQYSIRVSRSWRLCFEWRDGDAFEVELNHHYD